MVEVGSSDSSIRPYLMPSSRFAYRFPIPSSTSVYASDITYNFDHREIISIARTEVESPACSAAPPFPVRDY